VKYFTFILWCIVSAVIVLNFIPQPIHYLFGFFAGNVGLIILRLR